MESTRAVFPLEVFSALYAGDYFSDTLYFSSDAHAVFRLLLLHLWLTNALPLDDDVALASIASLTESAWLDLKPEMAPLLVIATANFEQRIKALRSYDGQRLPAEDWSIVRTITLERDGYVCTYCGTANDLHVDHKIPLSRGGSNTFDNLTTSCGPCNQSKASKTPEEWQAFRNSPKRPVYKGHRSNSTKGRDAPLGTDAD